MIFITQITGFINNGFRTIKAALFGANDVRSALEAGPAGIDSCPVNGQRAIYLETGKRTQPIIIGYVNVDARGNLVGEAKIMEPGGWRAYSTSETGDLYFNIMMPNIGKCYIGASKDIGDYTDYLTRFNEMQTAFNQFTSDFNTFIAAYNTHTHPSAAGETSAPIVGATTTSANMDDAKTSNIRVQ
jgi:hypothetical protein